MPAVGDMQRPGGIGGNEFNLHAASRADLRAAVGRCPAQDPADFPMIGIVGQEKIDEAGPGDLHLGDGVARRQRRQQAPARSCGDSGGRPCPGAWRDCWRSRRAVHRACVSTSMPHLARRRGHQVFGQRLQGLLQQVFDQGLQKRIHLSDKGCAVYRKALNRLPADRHRSTSAGPGPVQRFDLRQPAGKKALQGGPRGAFPPANARGSDRRGARSRLPAGPRILSAGIADLAPASAAARKKACKCRAVFGLGAQQRQARVRRPSRFAALFQRAGRKTFVALARSADSKRMFRKFGLNHHFAGRAPRVRRARPLG